MTVEFSAEQRAAIDAPFEASLEIAGASRTRKDDGAARTRSAIPRAARTRPIFLQTHPCELVALARHRARSSRTPRCVSPIAIEARRAFAAGARSCFDLTWPELQNGAIDPEVAALRGPQRFLDAAYRLVRKLRDAASIRTPFSNARSPARPIFTPSRPISPTRS